MANSNGDQAKSICTASGYRSEATKRAWVKLRELEAQGVPTFDKFGGLLKESYKEVRAEAERSCAVPSSRR